MFKDFLIILKEALKGKSLVRTLLNLELRRFELGGRVLDIGGGEKPSYLRFFKISADLEFINLDIKAKTAALRIDLEKDKLPFVDRSMDKILLFNILEHIYNYPFLLKEVHRVLKDNGEAIGFVPFLVGFHPDPHDYFRFTRESLENIFRDAGFSGQRIKELGRGLFSAHCNIISGYLPRLSLLIYPLYYIIDRILGWIQPNLAKRFPLGYLFIIKV